MKEITFQKFENEFTKIYTINQNDITEAINTIYDKTHDEADIIFGTQTDDMLENDYIEVKVFMATE